MPYHFLDRGVPVIAVQSQYCPQNHRCPTLRACPTGALQQQGYDAPTIDAETCIECGRCVSSCRVFREVADRAAVAASGRQNGKNGSSVAGGLLDKLTR